MNISYSGICQINNRTQYCCMANKDEKNPLNVTGKYYNDVSCIDCDLCREIAPSVFTRDDEEGLSYVYKQPETEDELVLVMEALESCPIETIGSDGLE